MTITDPVAKVVTRRVECPADAQEPPFGCGLMFDVEGYEPHQLVTCPECGVEFDHDDEEDRRERERQRVAFIAGLRDLADFLQDHDAVPLPHVSIYGGYRTGPAGTQLLAQWVDGLDEVEVEAGLSDQSRKVVRSFAGLRVGLDIDREHVGEIRVVERPVEEFTPLTAAEIRERAREGIARARRSLAEGLARAMPDDAATRRQAEEDDALGRAEAAGER